MRRLAFSVIGVIAVAAIVIGINMFADARLANQHVDLTHFAALDTWQVSVREHSRFGESPLQ